MYHSRKQLARRSRVDARGKGSGLALAGNLSVGLLLELPGELACGRGGRKCRLQPTQASEPVNGCETLGGIN